ncbi:MAG: hypothetical protein ACD_76C00078G0004 [uncultured bacterium]|nr:MAG: hypothetical protein ACD_76C00078G0004 [uncultured bacterium]HBD05028.1 hypothetical protein [Candidatus Uhrbacteria bacterium]
MAQTQPQQSLAHKPLVRYELSAGGLVYREHRRGPAFAMLIDSYGKTTFPKGHVRRGESVADAARREIFEELGLSDLKKIRRLGKIDIEFVDKYVHKGTTIRKRIYYFLFKAPKTSKIKVPEKREKGKETIHKGFWVPIGSVEKVSSYKDLEDIIKSALSAVQAKLI